MTTPTIFLSYASQDADAARRLCDALHAFGLAVWFDQSDLRSGDAWDASIRKQIKECALFVPIISHNTQQREEGYFRLEWKLAVDRSHLMADDKAFFFPVILGDVAELSARVPDKFRERQWTRIIDDATIATFAAHISKQLSTRVALDANEPVAAQAANVAGSARERYRAIATHSAVTPNAAFKLTSPVVPHRPAIAVLPFANMSGAAEDEFFTDGMTEEIINALAQIGGLKVAARTSCFAFKGKNEDLRSVAKKLGVTSVLEGSVRKAGTRLRITAQLVNAADGCQLWSERYDRELVDVFALQDELTTSIANKFRLSMSQDAGVAFVRGALVSPACGRNRPRLPVRLPPAAAAAEATPPPFAASHSVPALRESGSGAISV